MENEVREMKFVEICKAHVGDEAHNLIEDPKINAILNDIQNYPHIFVLACLMDKQIKAERAWSIPYTICVELCNGCFDFEALEKLTPEQIRGVFEKEKLHRYNKPMSEVFYEAIQYMASKYKGDASRIWQGQQSSAEIIYRFLNFKGCGIKIASMATNLLHRNFGIKYTDYSSLDISPDIHIRRVMYRLGLIDDMDDTTQVIYRARSINPEYPGQMDECCWEIGRNFCKETNPKCSECKLDAICMHRYYE